PQVGADRPQVGAERPQVVIQVTGGGSGTGIAALINGGTDICQSSRPMKENEKKAFSGKQKKEVKEIPVAIDAISIYVHKDNPLKELTLEQIKNIFTGKIVNWSNLIKGWADKKIVAYSRENNSGTYLYFKEHILNNEDFATDVQTLPGTAAVVNAVSKDLYSIGYGGIAYGKGIRFLKVKKDEKSSAVEPTPENVYKRTYPISRELYFYLAGEPQGEIKNFINWVLSAEGQKICEEVGYFPLR
ncbi:MAG TPA: phosphate-binding protein, partial [Elusimicrobia bacterium]|nr:phosphate-binding protein [Elusimicrobiota bacterium]